MPDLTEHQRAAIRDPHNAAYHEARGEIEELRAEVAALRAALAGCVRYQSMRTHSDEQPYYAAWTEAQRLVEAAS